LNPFATANVYLGVQRNQWLSAEALRRMQCEKLRALVAHAYRTVPFYRDRFAAAGVGPEDLRTPEDLRAIPVTTKADLQAAGPDAVTSSAFPPEALTEEHTSGSTGRPLTVRFDPHFVRAKNAMFLRALGAAGYRPGQRLLLITGGRPHAPRPWLRWRYASLSDPPEGMLEALDRFRPHVLYGCMTALRQLAAHVRACGLPSHRPRVVVSTAETLDDRTRGLLAKTFRSEVFDIYGLTETGFVGWECGRHDGYHMAEDTAIVECAEGPEPAPLVVTNLELRAMPMIRFHTGDLGLPAPTGTCACGRSLRRLRRLAGRQVDAVRCRDGRTVSPYRMTLAIERIAGIRRYQLVQEDFEDFLLRVEGNGDLGGLEAAAREAIGDVLGPGMRVRLRPEESLDPPAGRKFRVVESHVASP
jgi:phenylacetate-coenzyme A ligase PaaK-like adenylate-forming protein